MYTTFIRRKKKNTKSLKCNVFFIPHLRRGGLDWMEAQISGALMAEEGIMECVFMNEE